MGFSVASSCEFYKEIRGSVVVQRQKVKTKYDIKIADLSCNSNLILQNSDQKKLLKFLERVNFHPSCDLYISIDMNIKEALYKKFKSLKDLRNIFKTNKDCIEFLEDLIWEGEPISPYDETSKVYPCKDGWYKCKNTGKEFNILTGTLFQNTKIALPIWFEIIFRMCSDKGGVTSTTVARDYGISQTTAWYMLQKIRNAMGFENHQELSGTVETDEYHAGGSLKNMHYDKKLKIKKRVNQNKKLLQGFIKRGGNLVIRTIPEATDDVINAGILRFVRPGSTLYSDDNPSYQKLPPIYTRGIVVHSRGNYVNKDNNDIYTNTMESGWAGVKRIENTYIKISHKHIQNYANEVVFRYNTTKVKMNSAEACTWLLQNIQGTNITWRQIRNAEYTQFNRNQARAA